MSLLNVTCNVEFTFMLWNTLGGCCCYCGNLVLVDIHSLWPILLFQESKGVEDFGDVIREGGGAFAKGLFRGVTGILTKPLEGAKASGVEGFVQGVGKGLIGAAAQPVSGVLDLLSKTTEGANAMRMKIASAIASEDQLLRRRLPRVISGDNLVRPYDEYKSQGQVENLVYFAFLFFPTL